MLKWLRLQGLLVPGPGRLWVLGFGSANAAERRSHTLAAFAPAAAERGIPVLAVTNRVPDDATSVMELEAFLTEPLRASARLGDVAWIRVPENWRWDVERRRRWMGALMAWSGREAVVLVELPPSAEPEALLMAELVPQLLWVVGSGIADGSDTEHHFEGLRHSGVRMVGVLLNKTAWLTNDAGQTTGHDIEHTRRPDHVAGGPERCFNGAVVRDGLHVLPIAVVPVGDGQVQARDRCLSAQLDLQGPGLLQPGQFHAAMSAQSQQLETGCALDLSGLESFSIL